MAVTISIFYYTFYFFVHVYSPWVGRLKVISPVWEGRGYNTDNTKGMNAIKNSKAAFLLHVVTLC